MVPSYSKNVAINTDKELLAFVDKILLVYCVVPSHSFMNWSFLGTGVLISAR